MDPNVWTSALKQPLALLIQRMSEQFPKLLGAAALLLIGWLLARLLRIWSTRLMSKLNWLVRSRPIQSALNRIGVERPVSEIIGGLVFWVVFLLFFTAATETLGLPVLATWLSGVSTYLPRVLAAVLIVFAGLIAGNLVRDAVATGSGAAGIAYGVLIGRALQAVIVLIALVTAVDQIGVESRFLTATITIVIGAVIGGAALAFGLGARTAVANIIAAHYLRKVYRVGHMVKVGDARGKIVEITPTAVILDSADGRLLVPAKEFNETVSVLLSGEA
jgi:small-conductance mechanosensitive channel